MIGPQQHYLVQIQSTIWKEGDFYRKKHQQIDHGKNAKSQRALVQSDYTMYDNTSTALRANGTTVNETQTKSPFSTTKMHADLNAEPHTSKGTSPHESPSTSGSVAMPNSTFTPPSSLSTPNSNTKERLKADMRLITATLKVYCDRCFVFYSVLMILFF